MAVYRSSPTFEMTKEDFKSYRVEVMKGIKTERMALMANGRILLWIDEELKRFEPKKEEKKEKV